MTLQQFHRFRDLPRELQLHIWNFYEAGRPHVRHYFRRMVHIPGCLYGAAPEDNPREPCSYRYRAATAQDPDSTDVPDPALTPDSKVMLFPKNDRFFVYDERVQEALSAFLFRRIQFYSREPGDVYRWVNFKLDTFGFTSGSRYSFHRPVPHMLDFLWDETLNDGAAAKPTVVRAQDWFFRVQKLDLLLTDRQWELGEFDRHILACHPSVKTITIVLDFNELTCAHIELVGMRPSSDPVYNVERIPLHKAVALLRATNVGPCCCKHPGKCLVSLQKMQQELVSLFSNHQQTRRVDVRVEVEINWWGNPRLDVDAIIARGPPKKTEEDIDHNPTCGWDPYEVFDKTDEADP